MVYNRNITLSLLGCGNLGKAILSSLVGSDTNGDKHSVRLTKVIASVRSTETQKSLKEEFSEHSERLDIRKGDNVNSVKEADVIVLAVDPADVANVLREDGLRDALKKKLLISVAAGWTRTKLEQTMYGSSTTPDDQQNRAFVLRTLPNIAGLAKESLTAIEISEPPLPEDHIELAEDIFRRIGRTLRVPPRLMDATTAVSGSTPAFFAVICDALIDASVAVGVPRDLAQTMIFQSMKGTAALLQNGTHPGLLKDQGTSPEGCTIGGLMVLEEAGIRGTVGRGLREAVTVSRLMETSEHLNDTRNK